MSVRDLIALARAPSSPTPPTQERGHSGAMAWDGNRSFGDEVDVNALWRPPARYSTVRQMRTHPDTNAAMDAIVLALLATDLEITPGSDDPQDQEIADFIWNDLNNLSQSFFDLRFEALDEALWNGCAPYQTVFALDSASGKYHLDKLAFRPPATITRWRTTEHGGPAGIVQMDDHGQEIEFEMDELVVFVHRRRGGDLTGTPLARRMYAPWYILDKLYRIGPAAIERHGMGVPTMRGRGNSAGENARIESILMGLKSAALAYVRLSENQEMADFEIKGLTGSVIDPVPMMEYMRRTVFLSVFAQQQVLGMDGVGSLAKAETDMDMLMVMLRAISKMETDTYNRYLIPRWVGYNWADIPESRLPKLTTTEPDRRDVQAWFTSLMAAVNAGVELDRDEVRRRAHDMLDVPISDEPKKKKKKLDEGEAVEPTLLNGIQIQSALDIMGRVKEGILTKDQANSALLGFLALAPSLVERLLNPPDDPRLLPPALPAPEGVPVPAGLAKIAGKRKSEIALEALGIAPNFARMATAFEEAEQRILAAATGVQRRQISNLLNRAREIVAANNPELVAATEVRFTDELQAELEAVLQSLYEQGDDEMDDELEQQGTKPVKVDGERSARDKAMIAAAAGAAALLFADRVKRAWSGDVLAQMREGGGFDRGRLAALLGGLSDKAILDQARIDTTAALSMGRQAAGDANAKAVDHWINTEVLDSETCAECEAIDGEEVAIGEEGKFAPYAGCEGGGRCRGLLAPVVARP